MSLIRLALMSCALLLLGGQTSWANQADVPLPLEASHALFTSNGGGGVRALTVSRGGLGFGIYPKVVGAHAYDAELHSRTVLLDFSGAAVWTLGLSAQTVVDQGNDIDFRLTRLFYDARTGVDFHWGPGVARAHWVHRCSHGVDGALEGRILIRNGLDVGYRWAVDGLFGRLEVDGQAHLTVIGQNEDLATQNRGLLSTRVQWSHEAGPGARLIMGAGVGALFVARSDAWEYDALEPASEPGVEWLPALTIGGEISGPGSAITLLFSSQRIADDGVGLTTRPRNLHAFRMLLAW
jgi:hypothetical protein